jgi:parvulin-like peptidyl-prolyl isomerase
LIRLVVIAGLALYGVLAGSQALWAQSAAESPANPPSSPVDQSQAQSAAESPANPPSSRVDQKTEAEKVILAKVGERNLTVDDIRRFAISSGLGDLARVPAGQVKLLRLMIEETLLDKALELEGLIKAEETERGARANAMASLQQKYFPLPSMPDESAVRAYYEANREQFGIPEQVRIVQIQFRTDQDKLTDLTARERAERALKRIESGEDFRKLAAELTESPRAHELGPDRGFLPRNAEPWLREAVKELTPGQRTGIVLSPAGYEILLISDWRAPLIADFDAVRTTVAEQMRRAVQQQAREAYVKTVAQKVEVKILQQGMKDANPIAH